MPPASIDASASTRVRGSCSGAGLSSVPRPFWVAPRWKKIARNLHRLACDTQAALFCESEPPLRVAHMPLPKSSVARLSPSIILVNSRCILRTPSHWREHNAFGPRRNPAGPSSFAECARILTGAFQGNAFGCGRCNPRGKSSGPALLEPSLKVQRDVTHNSHSAFAAEVHRR
jgi:hypothetical protein